MTLPEPADGVIYQSVQDGAILLHLDQEVYFGLNSVGAEIWQLLPPTYTSLKELREELAGRYPDVPVDLLEEDIVELIEALVEAGLATRRASG